MVSLLPEDKGDLDLLTAMARRERGLTERKLTVSDFCREILEEYLRRPDIRAKLKR